MWEKHGRTLHSGSPSVIPPLRQPFPIDFADRGPVDIATVLLAVLLLELREARSSWPRNCGGAAGWSWPSCSPCYFFLFPRSISSFRDLVAHLLEGVRVELLVHRHGVEMVERPASLWGLLLAHQESSSNIFSMNDSDSPFFLDVGREAVHLGDSVRRDVHALYRLLLCHHQRTSGTILWALARCLR